jgi:hypothetical protein
MTRPLERAKVVRFLGTRRCPSELNSKTARMGKAKPPVFTHGPTALLSLRGLRRSCFIEVSQQPMIDAAADVAQTSLNVCF